MSVVNGQIANQTTFNNAFMSRTAATTQTIAQVQLENTEVESGPFVANVQRAVNKAFEGVGATGEADTTVNDYSSNNYIANGDNRKVAVGKLDTQLKQTQDDLDLAEGEIAIHETRLDAHDLTLADHEARIDAAELTIADHETRLDSAELTIADHESRITQNETDIADHEARITDLESNDMNIGGNKTFTGNVVVQGDFEVQGTLTSVNSTNLEVEDQNILVNKNGSDGSAEGAGVDVERPSGNAGLRFDSALASKFKIGLLTNLYEIIVSGVAQTIAGLKDFTSGIKTDTIDESTLNSGVTVESVLIKDGLVDNRDVSADGTTLDGHTATLANHETRIDDLEADVATLQSDVGVLQTDVSTLQSDVSTLQTDVGSLQTDVASLQLDVADHESRITDIESGNNTFAGTKTFSGDVTVQQTLTTKNLVANEILAVGAVVNTQTGADQQIDPVSPLVKLTGVGLTSIDRLVAPLVPKIIALVNQTGSLVVIKDNAGTPSANRIRTGTGANVNLENNQIAFLVYDPVAAFWYLSSVGGTGGGGGATGKKTFDMKLNGLYGGSAAYNGVDGLWVAPSAMQITNVFIYQEVAGSGGTTTLDLKVKPFLSGAYASIFLTAPAVTPSAGANAWCGVGDSVTGFTAPVLTSLPFAVAAKSALRMDLLGAQSGNAAGVGLLVVYEEL